MMNLLKSSLLLVAISIFYWPIAANAGSYGKVTNKCMYYVSGKLIYSFDCRVMYSGDSGAVSFIDNYKSDERYTVGDEGGISGEITGFRQIKGNCMVRDYSAVKICWKGGKPH